MPISINTINYSYFHRNFVEYGPFKSHKLEVNDRLRTVSFKLDAIRHAPKPKGLVLRFWFWFWYGFGFYGFGFAMVLVLMV